MVLHQDTIRKKRHFRSLLVILVRNFLTAANYARADVWRLLKKAAVQPVIHIVQSFKFKIACTVTAMVLVAGMGVGGVSLLIAEEQMRQVIAQQELSVLSSAAAFIDNDVRGKQELLKSITEQMPGQQVALDDVQALIEAHPTLRDAFFNVTAFDMAGKLVASLNDRNARGKLNVANRAYFKDTLAAREGLISAPFRSSLSNKPIVAITQPLLDKEGRIIGVLLGAIDLLRPSFSGHLNMLDANSKGYFFIVANDGTFIHHPNKELILTKGNEDPGSLVALALSNPEGWRDDVLDNDTPILMAHKKLNRLDWTIAAAYPIQDAFKPMVDVRLRAIVAASLCTALAGLFGWGITKGLMRPLAKLQKNIEQIDSGVSDIKIFDVERADEFGVLSRALYTLSRHRQQSEHALHQLATTDALTGLNNRRMFDTFLPKALARATRSGDLVGLALLDVDFFKTINDTHGHAAGDIVLVEFARRLHASVRRTDTVARLAGDEFVIVFEQLADSAELSVLGEKLIDAMQEPFLVEDKSLKVSASIGIAFASGFHATPGTLMHAADQALYTVKDAGRNGYRISHWGIEGHAVASA